MEKSKRVQTDLGERSDLSVNDIIKILVATIPVTVINKLLDNIDNIVCVIFLVTIITLIIWYVVVLHKQNQARDSVQAFSDLKTKGTPVVYKNLIEYEKNKLINTIQKCNMQKTIIIIIGTIVIFLIIPINFVFMNHCLR